MNKIHIVSCLIAAYFCSAATAQPLPQGKILFTLDLIRHGDRTPIIDLPNSPYQWGYPPGALTGLGQEMIKKLGSDLRNHYVGELGLLPPDYQEGTIFVRSTDVPRTVKSAEALLQGLYPEGFRRGKSIPIQVTKKSEDGLIVKHQLSLMGRIRTYWNSKAIWKAYAEPYQGKINHWQRVSGLKITNPEELFLFGDHIFIRNLHKVPQPAGLTEKDMLELFQIADQLKAELTKVEPACEDTARVVSNLLNYYLENVKSDPKSRLKYVLLSAHDNTLMCVLSQMGTPVEKNPPFGSRINYLFLQNGDHVSVKASYNEQPLTPRGCTDHNCPVEQFFSRGSH